MANRGRATFAKRQREIQRQERAREKAAKRVEREATKTKLDRKGEVDPDIADIAPGPQPRLYDLPDELPAADAEAEAETEDEAG
jgi:hypothetical protein